MIQEIQDDIKDRVNPLNGYRPKIVPRGILRSSAVLIPILTDPEPHLIYTLRSAKLKKHAGQISFPGGRVESGENPWEAALREAHEEIGIEPEQVTCLGRIDDMISPHGYHIQCFVGLVHRFQATLNPDEVDALVPVTLNELFDETLHATKPFKNHPGVHYFTFEHGLVWGVTGHITWRLRQILNRSD